MFDIFDNIFDNYSTYEYFSYVNINTEIFRKINL